MVMDRRVVGRGFRLMCEKARASVRLRVGARIARSRQGNWRKRSSGRWCQTGALRGVRRRVMVRVRMAREVRRAAFRDVVLVRIRASRREVTVRRIKMMAMVEAV